MNSNNVTLWKRNGAMSAVKGFVHCFSRENSWNRHRPLTHSPLSQDGGPDSCAAPVVSAGLYTAGASLGRCICRRELYFKTTENLPFLHALYFSQHLLSAIVFAELIIYTVTKLHLKRNRSLIFSFCISFMEYNSLIKTRNYPTSSVQCLWQCGHWSTD